MSNGTFFKMHDALWAIGSAMFEFWNFIYDIRLSTKSPYLSKKSIFICPDLAKQNIAI